MNLLGLNVVLNHSCNIECRHCFYNCKPSTKGLMEFEDFKRYLKTVAENNKLRWVGLGCGGEVFLHFDRLVECLREASSYDIKDIYVMTNAFWASTPEKAAKHVNILKDAGLNIIWFSLDAFHQEFVPIENVINATNAALDAGIKTVSVTSEYFIDYDSDNKFDAETRNLIQIFKERLGKRARSVLFDRYILIPGGRASDIYFDHIKEKEQDGQQFAVPAKRCRGTIFWGKNLKDPFAIEIDMNGIVELCPGLPIGDVTKRPLEDLLKNYNYKDNPIIEILVNKGLEGLLKLAEEKGYARRSGYMNECQLCYDLRKFLQPYYPEYLSPASCY